MQEITPRMSLGRQLREWRLARGLTQMQVSTPLGHGTAQFVSNWERGISLPPYSSLRTLSKLLGVRHRKLVDLVIGTQKAELDVIRQRVLKEA